MYYFNVLSINKREVLNSFLNFKVTIVEIIVEKKTTDSKHIYNTNLGINSILVKKNQYFVLSGFIIEITRIRFLAS